MFRESISLKCGHVGTFFHTALRGNVKVVHSGSDVNSPFMTLWLVQSWEASLIMDSSLKDTVKQQLEHI